jgi:hypothetical protein
MDRRAAQIGVNEQHAPAVRLAEREGEIHDGERLAFARDRAGDHDRLEPFINLRVVKCRSQSPVLLCAHRVAGVPDD